MIDRHIIEAKYADGQATLLIADTPSAENYADFGTRMNYVYPSDPLEGSLEYRRKCTWERLLAVQKAVGGHRGAVPVEGRGEKTLRSCGR